MPKYTISIIQILLLLVLCCNFSACKKERPTIKLEFSEDANFTNDSIHLMEGQYFGVWVKLNKFPDEPVKFELKKNLGTASNDDFELGADDHTFYQKQKEKVYFFKAIQDNKVEHIENLNVSLANVEGADYEDINTSTLNISISESIYKLQAKIANEEVIMNSTDKGQIQQYQDAKGPSFYMMKNIWKQNKKRLEISFMNTNDLGLVSVDQIDSSVGIGEKQIGYYNPPKEGVLISYIDDDGHSWLIDPEIQTEDSYFRITSSNLAYFSGEKIYELEVEFNCILKQNFENKLLHISEGKATFMTAVN